MRTAPRAAVAAALGAAGLLAAAPPPAGAAPVVTLLSGLLTVSAVPASATLTTSGATSSGSLGTTTVVDGRLGATGYTVSLSTAGFDLVGALSSNSQTHVPTTAVTVQNTAVTGGTSTNTSPVTLPSATPVFGVTYSGPLSGLINLTSTFTIGMTVAVPASAAPGLYTGTVTQTVV